MFDAGNISELEKKAAALEAELFGETSEEEKPTQEYYELTTVSQGKKGFARVKEAREKMCPFALAFLDIRMPTDGKYSELFKIRRPF